MALGEEHVPEAQAAGLGLELFDYGGVGLPSRGGGIELGLEEGVGGDAVFLDEFFDLLLLLV